MRAQQRAFRTFRTHYNSERPHEALEGALPEKRRGRHSLRRKFASDPMHKPLKVLCQLGGWKTERTVFECYQHADEGQMREALEDRRRA